MSSFSNLNARPIQTRLFQQGENLADFICEHISPADVKEKKILAVTSKIVSLSENRLIDKNKMTKAQLVDQEADHNLGEVGYGCFLTIKEGLFIPSAGIDESNSERDQYILYPADPFASAQKLHEILTDRWQISQLAIVMTDSHTTPLRKGVTGISLAHWGFQGLKNLIGEPDLFGRPLQMTTVNVADALAVTATLLMGEANESRPLALLDCDGLVFTTKTVPQELKIPLAEDLYYPFFKNRITSARK